MSRLAVRPVGPAHQVDALSESSKASRCTRGTDVLGRPLIFAPLLVGLAAALSLWFANRGLPIPDEGAILTNAAKILRGAVFYRELDADPFPGATYCLAFFMKLFGEHLSVARGLAAPVNTSPGSAGMSPRPNQTEWPDRLERN